MDEEIVVMPRDYVEEVVWNIDNAVYHIGIAYGILECVKQTSLDKSRCEGIQNYIVMAILNYSINNAFLYMMRGKYLDVKNEIEAAMAKIDATISKIERLPQYPIRPVLKKAIDELSTAKESLYKCKRRLP